MSYDDIVNHITEKIIKVNPNNPKANWGARVLKELKVDLELLDDYLYWAINAMQVHFNTNSPSNPAGRAGLTMLSMAVGENILSSLDHKKEGKLRHIDQIRVGDLILEPFIRYGYVDLVRPPTRDTMYFIEVTKLWPSIGDRVKIEQGLIKHIYLSPISDGCMIKGESIKRSEDTVWCRSAVSLMEVPWRINTPVYEALIASKDMFVSEESIDYKDDDYLHLQELRRRSKLMDFKMVVRKAKEFLDKEFFMEMEADYRGRLYYKEAFLNFQGNDWARGLMLFGKPKTVTPKAEYWMAVHTANSYNQNYDINEIPHWCEADYVGHLKREGLDSISVDKFTLDDRVRWTNENMDWIEKAGREKTVYKEAEKPVSFLACCIEWLNLWEATDAGRTYKSSLPIPIDGSNNGWQHLGAISKDVQTAGLVGLIPQEIQQDFYVSTAKQLMEIDDPKLNAMPMKHIRKGISKRGSMTRAYSAGAAKMAENMWFDCRTEDYDNKYDVTYEDCEVWSKELVKAINEVCPGPLKTMNYLQKLALYHIGTHRKYKNGEDKHSEFLEYRKELNDQFQIAKDDRDMDRVYELMDLLKEYETVLVEGNGARTIKWQTPSQFPVYYECFQWDDFKCRGTINGKQIKHVIKIRTNIPDVKGYMSGISPNYVHSMDATHMAMIVDKWDDCFGAVHDSFSTHACDVEDLLDLTKETFIQMYDVDNFYDKIREDITGATDSTPKPQLGDLDIQGLRNSDYFFS